MEAQKKAQNYKKTLPEDLKGDDDWTNKITLSTNKAFRTCHVRPTSRFQPHQKSPISTASTSHWPTPNSQKSPNPQFTSSSIFHKILNSLHLHPFHPINGFHFRCFNGLTIHPRHPQTTLQRRFLQPIAFF